MEVYLFLRSVLPKIGAMCLEKLQSEKLGKLIALVSTQLFLVHKRAFFYLSGYMSFLMIF